MRFFKYLYWGDDIPERKRLRIKWRLKVRNKKCSAYIITLCEGQDQLEIYQSSVLMQDFYKIVSPMVVGIAGTYDGAVELVRKIAEECYRSNQDCDLKRYLAGLGR